MPQSRTPFVPNFMKIRSAVLELYTYLKRKVQIVGVCMFAYSSKRDIPIFTKLGILILWYQEENSEGSKLRKNVLSSIPSENGSCSSETKHDRRSVPRPKLIFSKGDHRNKGHSTEKVSWVRVLMRTVSVARKLCKIKERRQGKICLFRRRDYRNYAHKNKNCPELEDDCLLGCSTV
jgi:hypothetical protein